MGLAIGCLPLRSQSRVIVLALIAFAAAGCTDPAGFNGDARSDATGAIAAQPASGRAAGGYWSWDGGVAVTVARGDTVDSIARRHLVPAAVIIQANNLAAPNALRPGQHLVVPRYSAAPMQVRPAPPRPDLATLVPPESIPPSRGGADVSSGAQERAVAPEDRPPGISARSGGPSPQASARAKVKPAPEQHPAKLKLAQKPAAARPPEKPAGVDPIKAEDAAARFHWPVRGQVIAGFGLKADGQRNDGIDIAVPENTPIKAADDGVVIYSGDQLKSFGNLVLVRHNNNYVTVYAHAQALRVKPGDAIKGGEVIGTAGQSGNVATPRVHFEIRKGSTPVDPLPLLDGA
jgi:murein DD-endopeptidase MepM/ murein hydrolase activator NlpD